MDQVWRGLETGVSALTMLTLWIIFLYGRPLRGRGSSGHMICLLWVVWLEGYHCGYVFREFWGIWVAESVKYIFGGFEGEACGFTGSESII